MYMLDKEELFIVGTWDFAKWFVEFVYEHWFLTWMFLWCIFGHFNVIKYKKGE